MHSVGFGNEMCELMNGLNFKHISEIICVWNSVPDQKVWNPAAYEHMREGH